MLNPLLKKRNRFRIVRDFADRVIWKGPAWPNGQGVSLSRRKMFWSSPNILALLKSLPLKERRIVRSLQSGASPKVVLREMASAPRREYIPFFIEATKSRDEREVSVAFAGLAKLGYPDAPLYVGQRNLEKYFNNEKNVVRRKQNKTGSQTVLLGGKLSRKVIVRYVRPSDFSFWKKAFEAKAAWKEAGFDYIPIEPILKKTGNYRTKNISLRESRENGVQRWENVKKGSRGAKEYVRVAAGVIAGPSMKTFVENMRVFYPSASADEHVRITEKLMSDAAKIDTVLTRLGIEHGHAHMGNFVVQMHNGEPRLYIIDFDQTKVFDIYEREHPFGM